MLIRFEDLTSLSMRVLDGSEHPIDDVLIDRSTLRLACVVADIGGWLEDHQIVIGVERFGAPDVRAGIWPAQLDRSALQGQPATEGEAGAVAPARRRLRAEPSGDADGLRSVRDWIAQTTVAAEDGDAGKLMGMIFESDDWRARYLIIETGGEAMPQNQRVVPVESVGEIDWGGRALRLTISLDRLERSPDLHEIDGLEGKWYNRVLAYYGLQS